MIDKATIREYYCGLCDLVGKKLNRSEYRKLSPTYSSTLIEKVWGNWTNFVNEIDYTDTHARTDKVIEFTEDDENIIITSIVDGEDIDFAFLDTLEKYATINNCKIGILWGKPKIKDKCLSEEAFSRIEKYLATEFVFRLDPQCAAFDPLLNYNAKNPLMNLDKISGLFNTVIVGSPKQYMKMLPYDQNYDYRLAYSTGTLSNIVYPSNISGRLAAEFDTKGALLLTYNHSKRRYDIRNLMFNGYEMYDLNRIYTRDGWDYRTGVAGVVLGDLHFPEEDIDAIYNTKKMLHELKPMSVMLHDWCSFNSINHHENHKYLTKTANYHNGQELSLEIELERAIEGLNDLANSVKDSTFYIVPSNHDEFIEKWLNDGEFIQGDVINRVIGCDLFKRLALNGTIFDKKDLAKNITVLPKNSSMEIQGIQVGKHGDGGLSGARGNVNIYTKGYNRAIIGHRHSPEIRESTIVAGTLSKLKLNYNQKGFTDWAHANVIIFQNGTYQLVFV